MAPRSSERTILATVLSPQRLQYTTRMLKKIIGRAGKKDNVMVDGRPSDIVIAVMGPSGVGKSTFINILLGKDVMLVSHGSKPCTSTLQYAIVDNPSPCEGHRVIIVDTPGFDMNDVKILRRITVWLASSYNDNMKLGGVIYLHNIADHRMIFTRRDPDMFRQLCGDNALGRVILGTTKWGGVKEKEGEKREQAFVENLWKDMIKLGSKSLRFDETKKSARDFLDAILGQLVMNQSTPETIPVIATAQYYRKMMKNFPVMILLMGEVGVGKSSFINTAAGKTLTEVGHGLEPCTSTVEYFGIQHHHHKRRVIFVDTPGFNHPTKADGDVLKGIVDWLKYECPKKIQFGGIIYLYDLSQTRDLSGERMMTPTKLHYPDHRAILATVDGNSSMAIRRENELKATVWRDVNTCQFMNTQDSAWSIVDTINPISLQYIQDELDKICTALPTQSAPRRNWSFFFKRFNFKLEGRGVA